MCQLGLLKICHIVLQISRQEIFNLFWFRVTLIIVLLNPKADSFMALIHEPIVPICIKIISIVSKISFSKVYGQMNGQVENAVLPASLAWWSHKDINNK